MSTTKGLSPKQIVRVKAEMVGGCGGVPVRFQIGGQTICNLATGELQPKGINVLYQQVYWGFTKQTALMIAGWLGAKPVFSE